MIKFSQLEAITGGKFISFKTDVPVISLITDSRKAISSEGALFFAIRGEHHDGHKFLNALYEQGIRQFIVEYKTDLPGALKDCNILLVESSVMALQSIAAYHRAQLTIPVIGITGSNGKTIIKEWLHQLLSEDYKIAKNPGSYNSQLGVPLSVWQLQPHHQLGIFEAGISKRGEMEKLQQIIQPTIGLFTNIGSAHDEGFSDQKEKTLEKLRLFETSKIVIYCSDHAIVKEAVRQTRIKSLSWGTAPDSDIKVKKDGDKFNVTYNGDSFNLKLPFTDIASIENSLHCAAVMLYFGYSGESIENKIQGLRSVPMRLELKEGINQCQIIDDTYNNDLAGLQISLEFLSNQHQKKKKRLILSDILESGMPEQELVQKVASLVKSNGVHAFVGVGKTLNDYHQLFDPTSEFYLTTEDFVKNFDWDKLENEIILVKGARTFQFEKIVNKLQRKVHGTVMEIDLGAVVHNLNFFKARLKHSTKIMAMVKAFAYGSGSIEIANILQYHKVDYLGVAYPDEGIELRKNHIHLPIMVMNPSEESFDSILQYNLEPELYSFNILRNFIKFLNGQPCAVHIKLDTGMHRLGFTESEITDLIKLLQENSNMRVASVFSHLAGADESLHDEFSNGQAERFFKTANILSDALGYKPLYHLLNSPGILRLPQFQFDMVRLGIGLYGIDPTEKKTKGLQPVATLKTIISQIKNIKAGETIGYGRRGKAEEDMTLATIAIGYADGFSRAFSRGVGEVMINGQLAKVIGNVCMDMTMVDITGIPAHEGDEVIIFGKELPIQHIAEKINTISYEILTSTSERVKRIFVAESI
jgi:Alr-MurF fusion protein